MAIFTVYVPPGVANAAKRADRTILLRDGFSLPAFLFGPLFLLYRRLWLAALAWVVVAVLIGVTAQALRLPPESAAPLILILALLTGFEATTLRQRALARRGYIFSGLFVRRTAEEAEQAFFRGEGLGPPSRPPPPAYGEPGSDDIIGLFPQAGEAG